MSFDKHESHIEANETHFTNGNWHQSSSNGKNFTVVTKKSSPELITTLHSLPEDWALVPLGRRKQPCYKNWVECEYSKDSIERDIKAGKCHAIGLKLGQVSQGIVAVDHDGESCDAFITREYGMSVDEALPHTVTVTSGRLGRYQKLYRVPEKYRDGVGSKVLKTGKLSTKPDGTQEHEQVNFRWTGNQSAVAGFHPHTGSYKWIEGCSPAEVEIAECPLWIIRAMLEGQHDRAESKEITEEDTAWAYEYLKWIKNDDLDWEEFRNILFALHDTGVAEEDALAWAATSSKHTQEGFDDIWKHIKGNPGYGLGTLGYWAKKGGWKSKKSHALGSTSGDVEGQDGDISKADFGNRSAADIICIALNKVTGQPIEDFITVSGKLHKWTGTHYKEVEDGTVAKQILTYLRRIYIDTQDKDGNWEYKYPYGTNKITQECLATLKTRCYTSIKNLPRSGMNLANGTLLIDYEADKPVFKLVPHDRKRFYLHCSEVEWNPDADTTEAEILLKAVDDSQLETFMRHQAMAFDFENVTKRIGRPRAGIVTGGGSNGKDSIRLCISHLYEKIGSFSFNEFQQYDSGKMFSLASMPNYSFSWASENSHKVKLENMKSLMAAIAANSPLWSERKGVDAIDYYPNILLWFSCNKPPITDAADEFIKSRFAIYPLNKTYKQTPDPSNPDELTADPRYGYDRNFQIKHLCPGLLKLFCGAYTRLWEERKIDWDCTQGELQKWAKTHNHLLQFAEETGLQVGKQYTVSVTDLYNSLISWYKANDYMESWESKPHRKDNPSNYDLLVTRSRDLFDRLKGLFPGIERLSDTTGKETGTKGRSYIRGIGFATGCEGSNFTDFASFSEKSEANGEAGEAAVRLAVKLKPLQIKDSEAGEAKHTILREEKFENENTPPPDINSEKCKRYIAPPASPASPSPTSKDSSLTVSLTQPHFSLTQPHFSLTQPHHTSEEDISPPVAPLKVGDRVKHVCCDDPDTDPGMDDLLVLQIKGNEACLLNKRDPDRGEFSCPIEDLIFLSSPPPSSLSIKVGDCVNYPSCDDPGMDNLMVVEINESEHDGSALLFDQIRVLVYNESDPEFSLISCGLDEITFLSLPTSIKVGDSVQVAGKPGIATVTGIEDGGYYLKGEISTIWYSAVAVKKVNP